MKYAKKVKDLQCLKTLQMSYLGHAKHHAKNRTSQHGLDHDTFFWMTCYQLFRVFLSNNFGNIKNSLNG